MTGAVHEPIETGSARPPAAPRVRVAVAIVVTRFPSVHETYVLREIDELERQGQPVVLVPLHRGRGKVMHEEAKPWIRRALYTPALSLAIVLANLRALFRTPDRYLGLLCRIIAATMVMPEVLVRTLGLVPKSVYLAGELRKRGVRHVHAEFATDPATAAYIMSAISDLTFSFSVHGPDVFVHRLLMREKIAAAKFIRTVSTFTKAFLNGLYPMLSEGKIEVVHVGLSPAVYARAAAESRLGPRPRIFSAARLTETKAFPVLIESCARLKRAGLDFECLIAGEGPQQTEIEEAIQAHDLADRVRLLGPVPQHEVARLIGDSDLFVLPSVIAYSGQMDGIPVALMEAMAAGLPVIASAVSAIPELVDDGKSGFLVDVTHPAQMASAIQRLIEDRALRTTMGLVGQDKVRRDFDVQQTAGRLLALLDRYQQNPRSATVEQIASLEWGHLNVRALGMRRVQRRRESFVAEVAIIDGVEPREVVIKQHFAIGEEARSPGGMARDEYERLRDIHARLAALPSEENVIYTVPRPLLCDERRGAVIMEHAPGRPLVSIVRMARNRGLARRRLVLPLRRAGAWLRRMQSVTATVDDGCNIVTAVVVLALRDLELARAADRTIARRYAEIAETLRRLETAVAAKPVPLVGHHGDFWTGNVFISERRVDVIDFEGFREGLPLEDVAYFLVHLEQYFAYPFLERVVPALRRAFLEGYSGGEEPDAEMLRLLTIAKALQLLARGGGAERNPLREFFRRRALHRVIRRGLA